MMKLMMMHTYMKIKVTFLQRAPIPLECDVHVLGLNMSVIQCDQYGQVRSSTRSCLILPPHWLLVSQVIP